MNTYRRSSDFFHIFLKKFSRWCLPAQQHILPAWIFLAGERKIIVGSMNNQGNNQQDYATT
jgi:hypothetical protein